MCTNNEIKLGLQQEKGRKNELSASDNVKNFFEDNRLYIENCFDYYNEYEANKADYIVQDCESNVKNYRACVWGRLYWL